MRNKLVVLTLLAPGSLSSSRIVTQVFHGPSTAVPAAQMGRTTTAGTNDQP